jgi:hypothetical protein
VLNKQRVKAHLQLLHHHVYQLFCCCLQLRALPMLPLLGMVTMEYGDACEK